MAEVTKTSLSQAALDAAATLFQGTGNVDGFKEVADRVEAKLHAAFDADAVAQKRANATGGGFRRSGGGKGGGNQDPGTLAFKGTKFAGKTIDEVYKMGASEAFANHQYADQDGNPQAGKNFIDWLSTKDGFMAEKCKAYLDGLKASQNAGTTGTDGGGTAPSASQETTDTTKESEFDFGGSSW